MVIIVNIICEQNIKWLKGNPYHWSDQTETLDSEYFSEIMNTENIPQCKSQQYQKSQHLKF